MRIALIGGAGFVGHHLGPRLRRDGHEVLILDHLAVNNRANHLGSSNPWRDRYLQWLRLRESIWQSAGCEFVGCDASDYHALSHCLSVWKPDAIVQLAAVAHITHTRTDNYSAFKNSIVTLRNALDAATAVKAKRFVYFSSSTVYGNFRTPVVSEDDGFAPDTTYGAYKATGELFVKAESLDRDLSYTIIRPQALYGPRCVSRRVTQIFIENALDQKPLRIDGDGSAMHDFTHIDDLCEGIAAVFSHFDESHNETFCITAGEARSLLDLAQIVQRSIPCEIVFGPPDPQKPSRGTMSVEKAHRLLGWEPRIGLDAGMESYANWYKEMINGQDQIRSNPDALSSPGYERAGPPRYSSVAETPS